MNHFENGRMKAIKAIQNVYQGPEAESYTIPIAVPRGDMLYGVDIWKDWKTGKFQISRKGKVLAVASSEAEARKKFQEIVRP